MAGFVWSEHMSVGVPALDADHRSIVRIVNLLQDVEGEDARRVAETVLDTLSVYCRYHFAREERVMAWCGFPGIAFHRGEHEGFTLSLARLQDMAYKPYVLAAEGGDTVADKAGQPPPLRRHRLKKATVP